MSPSTGKILVVDDGDTNRKLIRVILTRLGYTVIEACNGLEAIELFEESEASGESFDCILMDMQMPVLDGYSATRSIREKGYTRSIIAITAHALKGDDLRCIDAGCSGYMGKPVDPDDLLRVVYEATSEIPDVPPVDGGATPPGTTQPAAPAPDGGGGSPIRSSLPADDPVFAEAILEFIDQLQERLDQIRQAWEEGENELLRQHLHWLKGAGGTAGFTALSEIAADLEAWAGSPGTVDLEQGLESLTKLVRRIEAPPMPGPDRGGSGGNANGTNQTNGARA